MLDLPGITATVFKALSTLNVRRADTLPRFTNSVTYLQNGSQQSYQREKRMRGWRGEEIQDEKAVKEDDDSQDKLL